ncbi:helix-turn-helix domain-containing protein [Lactobacillus helveticus]|uniref:helix-turn-helix domain-containing protein n=1 Tax=Lactobacillus helveticus TaxID=1587 RepID=UPI0009327C48|nr:helix-turn-helix domain-containing protein [Lactobacillus helveticus]MDN5994576.1 helix-turn-helix domain-containing protein [Lactococcus lactis]MCO0807903.1 helix-turn-helix domain-containing protein [Lactobacillus helveticus]MCP9317719.1 helix-turn-helix domain-containing protein [Lactobacillus helveticus]MDN6035241.1 helix-turn-helix domain-containing protein [Lactococcus lactis]MDN6055589.1 helix-turn-helix domain-containing protein [Lactococcus lactis]
MAKKQIESKVLTVSEIAEKAGVSRNKVWSYIRRKKIEPVEKKNKVFKFNASIVLEIKRKQEKKQVKNISTTDNSAISSTVLEILQKQLEIKDDQIRKQQETIEYLKNENISFRLEASKQKKLLEDKQAKLDAISESDLKRKENNKHWWQRLF